MTMLVTFRMNHIENTVSIIIDQQYLNRCMLICCSGNPFTEHLPSDSFGIVKVFTSRHQAMHVLLMFVG